MCRSNFDKILFLTVAVSAVSSIVAVESNRSNADHSSYRLPKQVIPIFYDLRINTRLGVNDFAYQGRVNITLKILETTDVIVVHSDGLRIREEKSLLYRESREADFVVPIASQSYDIDRQFYALNLSTKVEAGVYLLVLYFEGEVRDDVFGFYRSRYVDGGKEKWMGVTQFSPTYARRAFPCMDEPHLKAIFQLRIGHVANQTATSNTLVESSVIDANNQEYRVTTFSPTPKMPTYLVGWAVHDFVPETSSSSSNFKIWTRRSMNHRGSISLNQGSLVYSSLKSYLSPAVNPVPKFDHVAVPDFNFNAMENWGMITFRESAVLYEGNVTPTRKMVDGFTTMTHEYAHTWFGNLVTPKFWNVAWLKEGFASFFQYFAMSMVQPRWNMMEKFVVDILQPTLDMDSANHSRVMDGRDVGSPSSIMGVLDFVSYKKGASVIRMLRSIIGDVAFHNGLRHYLKDMSYGAASPNDLYEYLQLASDSSSQLPQGSFVKDIMETWTNQPGFPLVTITRDYERQTLTVSQQRFRYPSSNRWWIPLKHATRSSNDFLETKPSHWLKPDGENLTIASFPSNDWVIFNVQQTGYYRVNYDEKNWLMLADYLRSMNYTRIHRVNRATLLDDVFNLARTGYVDYSIAFNVSSYLMQETDYVPWVAAVNNFKFLNKMLSSVPRVQRAFQEYGDRLTQRMYKQLSFNESFSEEIMTKLYRELILSTSCLLSNPDCLMTSRNLFQNWIAAPSKSIPKDVKSFVYCEGIRNGSEKDWRISFDRWLNTDLHTEYELLLQGLGCTRNVSLINTYLQLSISNEPRIRKQYRISIVNAVLDGHPTNAKHVLQFVRENLSIIIDRRGYGFLEKMITAIGNAMTTMKRATELRSFVEEQAEGLGTALNSAKQAANTALETVEWIKKYSPIIAKCLG